MNTLETLISKKMKKAEPTLDILGADLKILQVACQDFTDYFKFTFKSTEQCSDNLTVDKIENIMKKDPSELDSFLTIWTAMWIKKWKQRVKLLFASKNQEDFGKSSTTPNGLPTWATLSCKHEMIDIMVSALLGNAEICGTRILAENILKMEVDKRTNLDLNSKEQLLSVLNNSLRKAREMAQGIGPLIYVRVDKNYYAQTCHRN
jgi:hypothetical protein